MKLQELATQHQTKQAVKVFESYFGQAVNFDAISKSQAKTMLNRVRGLITEHRRQPEFHVSERNPAYLKLVMMEQALRGKLMEFGIPAPAGATPAPSAGATTPANPAAANAAKAAQLTSLNKIKDPKLQAAMKKSVQGQTLNPDEQQLVANAAMASGGATMENRAKRGLYNLLRESEIQQAQVVLAAQDMVDRMQKMIEEVTALQFKDLPALVDQIKNEVGVDQSMQFNQDATAALGGLVQNLQGSKQQLEQALGVVTGQGPAEIPGAGLGGAELGGEVPPMDDMGAPPPEGEEDISADLDIEEPASPKASFGRGRR